MPRRARTEHHLAKSPRPRLDRPRLSTVYVVGAGRMGTALALGLQKAGWKVLGLWSRSPGRRRLPGFTLATGAVPATMSRASLVLLTVPDRAVASMAGQIAAARLARPGQVFAHAAGALDLSPLGALALAGAEVGSLHPLLAATSGSVRLRGRSCAIDGSPAALRLLNRAARALGLTPLAIPATSRGSYHAAATLVATSTVTVLALASDLLASLGVPREEGLKALASLAASSLQGVLRQGVPGALTGPISRGDTTVVEAHLEALRGTPAMELYRSVARAALPLARAQGTDEASLARVEAALQER